MVMPSGNDPGSSSSRSSGSGASADRMENPLTPGHIGSQSPMRVRGRLRAPQHRGRLHHHRCALARRRDGAPVLQATCSGPPTDSPSGWPRCHRSVGSIKPPTRTPSTSSARRQAAPRAQRTRPWPRVAPTVVELPGGPGRRTSRSSHLRARASDNRREQKRWCSATAWYSRKQRSHRRSPKVRVTPGVAKSGRRALQVGHIV